MSHKALVFLSCGQRDDERECATKVQQVIEKDFGLQCYNADSQQGFDDVMSITKNLSRADYYLFIDFKRDQEKDGMPISLFTHQEFALARAWRITEMLAFKEKGLRSYGMLQYVLAHPVEFERPQLEDLVRENIRKKGWKADYSRNLIASTLVRSELATYRDGHGENLEEIWRVTIQNGRTDRAAINTVAILDHVCESATGKAKRPDTTFLKWSGQNIYQRTILPDDSGEIDAFSLRVSQEGVFLHSASDVFPREPIITMHGEYILQYLLYADSSPPRRFKIRLNYQGAPKRQTALNPQAQLQSWKHEGQRDFSLQGTRKDVAFFLSRNQPKPSKESAWAKAHRAIPWDVPCVEFCVFGWGRGGGRGGRGWLRGRGGRLR